MRAGSSPVGLGIVIALISALAFGTSGTLAAGLLATDWSPLAIVMFRVGICAAALLGPALLALRGNWSILRQNWRLILGYGVIAIALTQLSHFSAVQFMPVAPALLVQYLAPLLIVVLLWARHGERPSRQTALGAAVAMVGLVLVLQVIGTGSVLDARGLIWSLVAMGGNAVYFLISANHGEGLPVPVLIAGGCLIALGVLGTVAALGLLPFEMAAGPVRYAGVDVAWWVPLVVLGLFSSAFAYFMGITGARLLGSRLASFVGLSEVIFAIGLSAVLVGQLMSLTQLLGGLLVVAGVVLVKLGEAQIPSQPVRLGSPVPRH